MNYTVDSVLFNALCQEFELEFIQTCVTIFLYGVYIHLFVSMIGDLSRRTMDGRVPLLMAVWVMFVFGTAEALFAFARRLFLFRALQLQVQNPAHENDVLRFAQTVKTVKSLQKAQNILFAANNLLTDAFLLYRCYLIWGRRVRVIILPGLLLVSACAAAILATVKLSDSGPSFITGEQITYILATVTNAILTVLVAGRIWWQKRAVSHFAESHNNVYRQRYETAIKIILESGALYCICSIVLTATSSFASGPGHTLNAVVYGMSYLVVNIIPTLALARGTREHKQKQDLPGVGVATARMSFAPKPRPVSNQPLSVEQSIESI